MAPKKKKSEKATGKKAVKEVKQAPVFEPLPEDSKGRYLAKIQDLECRLERCQRTCNELEVREKDIVAKCNFLESEKKDIVHYLQKCLAQKEDKLADLSKRFHELQEAKDAEKESYEKQLKLFQYHEIEYEEMKQSKEKITSENKALVAKLATMDRVLEKNKELMIQVANLKDEISKQKQPASIADLKKTEPPGMKGQKFMLKMKSVKQCIINTPQPEKEKEKVEDFAKDSEILQLSGKTKMLVEENDALRDTLKNLKKKIVVMETFANEKVEAAVAKQKVIQQMLDRQAHTELQIDSHVQKFQQLLNDYSALQKNHEALRKKYKLMIDKFDQKQTEAENLKKQLQEEKILQEQRSFSPPRLHYRQTP